LNCFHFSCWRALWRWWHILWSHPWLCC